MADISIYLLTFNCARTLVQAEHLAPHLWDALPPNASSPDLLVFSLQEIAPIAYAFLGGSFLQPYFTAIRDAVRLATKDYVNVTTRNLGMTAIMIFAKDATRITSWKAAGVGVGVQEMGNKGAVGVHLVHAETQLTFVAVHLAPMEDGMLRRNADWKNIVQGMVFCTRETGEAGDARAEQEDVPLLQGSQEGEASFLGIYNPRSHVFVAGDLNYRVSNSKPTATDIHKFPQPIQDPGSVKHYKSLLKKDQLLQQIKRGKALHGFSESDIDFPPTYKLLTGEDSGDWNWASHRWPSWCDRILFLEPPVWMKQRITVGQYIALPQLETSDHRPVALSLSIPSGPISDPPADEDDIRFHPPFDLHTDWKSRRSIARRKEIAVGIAAYLALSWEGNGIVLAVLIGSLGGWLVIRSLLEV